MRKHVQYFTKATVLVLIIGIILSLVTKILMPKYFYNNNWPTTSTYLGFYEMKEDTVDVLALGSSHIVSAFSPQELYNQYQIRSYNLGCEQQNLLTSYYWLKEALRYQSPKAVILETYMLFPYELGEGNVLNTSEACMRKAFDYMRWSEVKREAVQSICELDTEQSLLSYYLPNIRFHSRWTELNEEDFSFMEMSKHYELKGFSALSGHAVKLKKYEPFELAESQEQAEMLPIMKEYLDKIKELCDENNIDLILVKTPTDATDIKKYNVCQEYAAENNISYFDFNEASLYREIGYDIVNDNREDQHANITGATKITGYLGRILATQYKISPKTDEQWENTKEYYNLQVKDCNLPYVEDIYEYMELLKDDRYTVFMAVRDDASGAMNEQLVNCLYTLGLSTNLMDNFRCSYYAVVENGNVKENVGREEVQTEGLLRNGKSTYLVSSAGMDAGDRCSIVIDNKEYAKNRRGLNLVVYNNESKKVIDSVCFDTCDDGLQAYR